LKEVYYRKLIIRKLVYIINSFIVNMIFSFQDHENVYIAMDLLTGGDLRYHIFKNKVFTEEQSSI